MELLYIVAGSTQSSAKPPMPAPIISLSKKNIIAISTTVDLLNTNSQVKHCCTENLYYVYVFDIESPANLNLVTTLLSRVKTMQWHENDGSLFLVTEAGTFYIFQMKDNILNSWSKNPLILETMEDIIAVTWLPTNSKIAYVTDANKQTCYADKFVTLQMNGRMNKIGGQAVEGALIVTTSGKVYVQTLNKNMVYLALNNISGIRNFIRIADCVSCSDGSFSLAYTDGCLTSPIICVRLSITCQLVAPTGDKMHIESKHNSGIVLTSVLEKYAKYDGYVSDVVHIEEKLLIIGYCIQGHSEIGIWRLLTKTPPPLHRFFTQRGQSGTRPPVTEWTNVNLVEHSSLITSIAIPRFLVVPDGGEDLFQYVAVAYQDGSVKLINSKSFISMTTTNLDTAIIDQSNDGFIANRKNGVYTAYMTSMLQSYTGCILVGIDQRTCVYVMKVVNTRDPVTQVPRHHLLSMLELCVYSNIDPWDIIAAIKPGIAKNMFQSFIEGFTHQPTAYQELLESAYLRVRLALAAYCSVLQQHAYREAYAFITLYAIVGHLKQIFGVRIMKNETGDAMEGENMEIDGLSGRAGELQCLLQWVINLNLVFVVFQLNSSGQTLGTALLNDPHFMSMLRESQAIVKHATETNIFKPVFQLTTPELYMGSNITGINLDMNVLEKLLTKITRNLDEAISQDIKMLRLKLWSFVCNKSNVVEQVFGPHKNSNLSPLLQMRPPLRYIFSDGAVPTNSSVDAAPWDNVRQMILGNPSPGISHKRCVRCGSRTALLPDDNVRNDEDYCTTTAWLLRFEQNCICGGYWVS